jgi:hypothetical protein
MSTVDSCTSGGDMCVDWDAGAASNLPEIELVDNPDCERIKLLATQSHIDNRIRPIMWQGEAAHRWLVDQSFLVSGKTDQERAERQKFWENRHTAAVVPGWLGVVAMAATGAGLFFVGQPIAVAVLAVALVLELVLTVVAFCYASSASQQVEQWKQHPTQKSLENHTAAYKNGFFWAMHNQLKGEYGITSTKGILHPAIVENLYLEEWDRWESKFQSIRSLPMEARAAFAEKLVIDHPLSREAVQYVGFGPRLGSYVNLFDSYQQELATGRDYFAKEKSKIVDEKNRRVEEMKKQKNADLYPLHEALRVVSNRPNPTPEEQERIRRYELLNARAAATIEARSGDYIRQLDTWEQTCYREIEKQKVVYFAGLFERAYQLFEGALTVLRGVGTPMAQAPQPYLPRIDSLPTPSAPPQFFDMQMNGAMPQMGAAG